MAKSIYTRVREAQARADREREAAEYRAGAHERRVRAGRLAAEIRKDQHIDSLIEGTVEPRTATDFAILDRAEYGYGEDFV